MPKRAAVVIGVAKTGHLEVLDAARDEAREVDLWLKGEGFDTVCLVDGDTRPVTMEDVVVALAKFVREPVIYNLLVVYFSGHGYWHARSDHWLLTGAHEYGHEAINLRLAADAARTCGIPTVVFLSDACRTLPADWKGGRVDGVQAFPNLDIPKTKVDWFMAASTSRAAYEGEIEGKVRSVFTSALLAAFEEPDPDMILKLGEQGTPIFVVPNRRLEGFLQRRVRRLLRKIDPDLDQSLEINVPSSDEVYMGTVEPPPVTPAFSESDPDPVLDLREDMSIEDGDSGEELADDGMDETHEDTQVDDADAFSDLISETFAADEITIPSTGTLAAQILTRELTSSNFNDSAHHNTLAYPSDLGVIKRVPDHKTKVPKLNTGFVIQGTSVLDAACSKAIKKLSVAIRRSGKSGKQRSGIVDVQMSEMANTVLLHFESGQSAILPALAGYVGHINFIDDGIASISYVPSSQNWLHGEYENRRERLDGFRGLVALAVDQNTLHIRSNRQAQALGDQIRVDKSLDPTLGVYAAHAYSQSGRDEDILSVLEYMRRDFAIDLFDVRLLANRVDADSANYPVFPPCPMLTQSWNVLRSRGITVHPILEEHSRFVADALWTTFGSESTDTLKAALIEGEFDAFVNDPWPRPGGERPRSAQGDLARNVAGGLG